MEREEVESTNIRSIGYSEHDQILEIEFLSGAIYEYYGVPIEIFEGIMSSESYGKYLNKYVKTKYNFRQV